ncbi:nucleotidyltransferase domain-containing protein [Thermus thermophilus]|uniref:nucleotidyltransferase domain-containing protein n=1 Tax=Thermus thermophilus TaxID=274 RepID=UPI00216AD61B|nr:nucleotidyltransferase domain-containing protein [Thermus thermophilus]
MKVFYPRWTREELLLRLEEGLKALEKEVPLLEAWLFGSWARGRASVGSDVDLLLLYRGPRREDLHRLARKAFPGLPLELHAYTEEEAARLEAVLARMREGPSASVLSLGPTRPPAASLPWKACWTTSSAPSTGAPTRAPSPSTTSPPTPTP